MVQEDEHALVRADVPVHVVLDDDAQRRRVIIVGDIHGCCDELRELLELHCLPDDTVILAGDLVNKGPKSAEVIRLARALRCHAVLGNHELATLRGRAARDGGRHALAATAYGWTDELSEGDVEFIRSRGSIFFKTHADGERRGPDRIEG